MTRNTPECSSLKKRHPWVYRWFPVIAAPYVDRRDPRFPQGFFQDQPEVRLGSAWAPSIPSDHGYSPDADALLHAVAVDLASLVTTSARASRPSVRWRAGFGNGGFDFFLIPDSTEEPLPLIRRIKDFLVQSFAVNLSAWHAPSEAVYWNRQLHGLIPGNRQGWWVISDPRSADSVGETLLAAFHGYGWPAMLAALDNPGFPPDPDAQWNRTFPLPPGADGRARERRDAPWFTRATGSQHDALFADIANEDLVDRFSALQVIGSDALDDPRAIPALLNSLEHDPSPDVRRMAASGLRDLASRDEVRHALRFAAAEDEDLEVRWEARYASRLAELHGTDAG